VSTTQELVERLKSLDGGSAQQCPVAYTAGDIDVLFYAAARLSELERENARLREALKDMMGWVSAFAQGNHCREDVQASERYKRAAAALAGSGEK
jgi:hypothetical protein